MSLFEPHIEVLPTQAADDESTWPLEWSDGRWMQYRQFQVFCRLRNVTSQTIADVVLRQYLPLSDDYQRLDWVVFGDLDWRLSEQADDNPGPFQQPGYSVHEFESTGFTNRYVEWTVPTLEPGATVHVGFTCGLRILRKELFLDTASTGFLHQCIDFDPVPRSSQQLSGGEFAQLTNLQEFSPTPLATPWDPGPGGSPSSPDLPFPPLRVGANVSDADERWAQALFLTSGLDWDFMSDLVADLVQPGGTDPYLGWYSATRARSIATVINAVVAGSGPLVDADDQGDTDEEASGLDGFEDKAFPGSPGWTRVVLTRALALHHTVITAVLESFQNPPLTIDRLRELATASYNAVDPAFRYCGCSESTYITMWFLRAAGIPCRELAGWGYGVVGNLDVYGERPGTGDLPPRPGDAVGHRIVEAYDNEAGTWFTVNTTTQVLGPSLEQPAGDRPTLPVATFRGRTGMHAPISYDYDAWVVSLDPSEGDALALPTGSAALPDEDQVERLRLISGQIKALVPLRYVATGSPDRRLSFSVASSLKGQLRAAIESSGVAPLALTLAWLGPDVASFRPPTAAPGFLPFGARCEPPDSWVTDPHVVGTQPSPFGFPFLLGLIVTLAAPSTVVDLGFPLTRNYLLDPQPSVPDRTNSRSRWAWCFVEGRLLYQDLRHSSAVAPPQVTPGDLAAEFSSRTPVLQPIAVALRLMQLTAPDEKPNLPRAIAFNGDVGFRLRLDDATGRLRTFSSG